MEGQASREAFDLLHRACRQNFLDRWRNGRQIPWDLVWSDTWNRVCSKRKKMEDDKKPAQPTIVTGVLIEDEKENANKQIFPAGSAEQIAKDLNEKDEKKSK